MLKIVGTIVNESRGLLGFIIEGKKKEFNEIGEGTAKKAVQLESLKKSGFKNRQITIGAKGVVEQGNFKMNELPMKVYRNNKLEDIPNGVALLKKFVQDGRVIGFEVGFADGGKANYSYRDVVQLSFWFKPDNFSVRTSANNKTFISGKANGVKLGDLPTIEVNNKGKAKEKKVEHVDVDILDVIEFAKMENGIIVNMPNEKYRTPNKQVVKSAEDFSKLPIGELAFPHLSYNDTKLNIGLNFRQPGIVPVDFGNGDVANINTFTYKSRTIFSGTESFLNRLGLAIHKQSEEKFLEKFSGAVGMKKLNDTQLESAVKAMTGAKDFVFYEINNSKMPVMSKSKIEKSILSTDQLVKLSCKYFAARSIIKYLNKTSGVIGAMKKSGISMQEAQGKKPAGMFARMSEAALEILIENGINIYDGNYTKLVKVEIDTLSDFYEEKKTVEAKNDSVIIDYFLKDYELKKWTGAKLISSVMEGDSILPKEVIDVILKFEKMPASMEKMVEALKVHDKYHAEAEKMKKMYWMHNVGMLMLTNNKYIHSHDKAQWTRDTDSKIKTPVYIAKTTENPVLAVNVSGVEMAN